MAENKDEIEQKLKQNLSIKLSNESCFDFLKRLDSNSISLILIDPPYEVSRDTNFASGEKTGKDTDRFRVSMDFGDWDYDFNDLAGVIKECYRVLKKGGTMICFYDLWKITTLKQYFDDAKFKQLRYIEWIKTNPVPLNSKTNYLTNSREIALVGVKGGKPTFHSEYDNGIYSYPICHDKGRFHPTQKPLALIEDLIVKHSDEGDLICDCFSGSGTTGCQWARSDNSYLGKKYIINRGHQGGRVSSIKLDGANDKSIKRNRGIRQDIIDSISKKRCAILDVGTQIEVDHKDGHYDVLSNQDKSTQKESDFQPLSKAANDTKRGHCDKCIKCGKRYDATALGYSQGFILGDENTKTCQGCYWYDPQYFNKIISKDYKKDK